MSARSERGAPAPAPILPDRRLSLQRGYARAMRRRAAVGIVVASVTLAAALAGPGRDLMDAWALDEAWRRAEPLDVVSIDVQRSQLLGVLHATSTIVLYRDASGERVAIAESFRGFWPPPVDARREARRDRASSRVLTSIGVASRSQRLATSAVLLGVLTAFASVLLVAAWRRLRELALARRALARPVEVVLELSSPPRRGRYVFLVPSTEPPVGGYRHSARGAPERAVVRTRDDEPPPLVVTHERSCALGLRAGGEVFVLREGLWPIELDEEERARARALLTARVEGP